MSVDASACTFWKAKYQAEATPEQKAAFDAKAAG